jgi:hypothetical protein
VSTAPEERRGDCARHLRCGEDTEIVGDVRDGPGTEYPTNIKTTPYDSAPVLEPPFGSSDKPRHVTRSCNSDEESIFHHLMQLCVSLSFSLAREKGTVLIVHYVLPPVSQLSKYYFVCCLVWFACSGVTNTNDRQRKRI